MTHAQTCAQCGAPLTPGQSFCDSCDAVVSWAQPSGPAPTEPARSDAVRPKAEDSANSDDSENDTAPIPPVTEGPPQEADSGDSTGVRARALLIPVADPSAPDAPKTPTVEPVLPGRPAAARPVAHAPGDVSDDDGPAACPWCRTGNRPDRHYCRRCAMPMAGQPEEPARQRSSWWRRLLDSRQKPVPWAGDRPRPRRGLGRILTWVTCAAVVVLLVLGGLNAGNLAQAVTDHFANRAPVDPTSYTASHSYPQHDPKLAFDKYRNTWWGPGVSEDGAGQWLQAGFAQPVNLLDVIITPGVSTAPQDLDKEAEPQQLEADVTTADGHTAVTNLNLDQGGAQRLSFHYQNVTAVRFVLRTAYGTAANKQVAIAEIEFFGPSSSGS